MAFSDAITTLESPVKAIAHGLVSLIHPDKSPTAPPSFAQEGAPAGPTLPPGWTEDQLRAERAGARWQRDEAGRMREIRSQEYSKALRGYGESEIQSKALDQALELIKQAHAETDAKKKADLFQEADMQMAVWEKSRPTWMHTASAAGAWHILQRGVSGEDAAKEFPVDAFGEAIDTKKQYDVVMTPAGAVAMRSGAAVGGGTFAQATAEEKCLADPTCPPEQKRAAKALIAQRALAGTPTNVIRPVVTPSGTIDFDVMPGKGRIPDQPRRITSGGVATQVVKTVEEAKKDLETVQLRLNDAETAAVQKTNPADLILLENFMQLAFGINPRGIRGSPQWFMQMEQIARGSLGARWAGEINQLMGQGLLSDVAREEAMVAIRNAAANRIASDQQTIIKAGAKVDTTPAAGGGLTPDQKKALDDLNKSFPGLK